MSDIKYAYLYSRVSREVQAEQGQGIERQIEAAKKFLENYPEYQLDNATTITDAGVSAYSGANIADSAGLGGFLQAVRSGQIARGSLLVIEAPDRLTRLGIRKGQRLFDELAEHGIDVGLVRFGVIVKHDLENDFTSSLIISVGLYLGHLESQQKSERIIGTMRKRQDMQRKGENIKAIHCPRWCDQKEDNSGFVINDFGKVIKRIFQLRIQGHGIKKIWSKLQEEGVTDISESGVHHYLTSRSVIGEFQPVRKDKKIKPDGTAYQINVPLGEPVKNFYPQLIDENTFFEVQNLLNNHPSVKGRKSQFKNYLRNIAKCPTCGNSQSINVQNGGKYLYFRCVSKSKANLTDCGTPAVNANKVDKYVLPLLRRFDFSKLTYLEEQPTGLNTAYQKEIEDLLSSIDKDNKALIHLEGVARDAVESVIRNKEQSLLELRKKAQGTDTLKAQHEFSEKVQNELINNPLETPDDRMRFNNNIKQFVEFIEIGKDEWTIKFIKGITVTIAYSDNLEDQKKTVDNLYDMAELLKENKDNDLGFVRLVANSHISPKVTENEDF